MTEEDYQRRLGQIKKQRETSGLCKCVAAIQDKTGVTRCYECERLYGELARERSGDFRHLDHLLPDWRGFFGSVSPRLRPEPAPEDPPA